MSFLIPLIGLIAGLLLGVQLNNILFSVLPILASVGIYFVILYKSKDPIWALKNNKFHKIWIFILFLGIGILDSNIHSPFVFNEKENLPLHKVRGVVEEVSTDVNGERYIVRVKELVDSIGNVTVPSMLTIQLKTDGYAAKVGDLIEMPANFNRILDNPNYRSVGYADRMKNRGILYSIKASSEEINTIGHNTIKSFFSSIKENIEIKIEKTSLSRPNKAFLIALFLGDKTFLSDETRKSFSSAGVAHVLALSGMHVATLMSLLLFIFYPLKFMRLHNTRLWICLLIIWGYALLTSLSPSTVRATIMLSFYIIAVSFQRKNESINALLGALFIILLLDPTALYDVGLQLSFVCVAVILCFVGKFNTVSRKHHPFLYYINALILTSVIVSLGTWPIISYYFGSVPLLFLPANLLMVPILPLYMALGLIYIGLVAIGWEPFILTCCLDYIYIFFSKLTSFVSSFPFASLEISVPGQMVFLWLAGLTLLAFVIYADKKRLFVYLSASFLILLIIISPFLSSPQPDLCIIQNYPHKISVVLYQDSKEHLIDFPSGKISSLIIGNNVIISIDSILETRHCNGIFNDTRLDDKQKYLIIGRNHQIDSLAPVIRNCNIRRLLIHPGMRKKKEEKLINEVNTYGSDLVYSLREEGPFEINL